MVKGKTVSGWSLAALLLLSLATTVFASDSDSDSDSDQVFSGAAIVGSWEAVSTLDTGLTAPGLFTFNADRTWMSSGDNAFFSSGHGAWKKIGPRRFAATNKAFVLEETGGVSLVFVNRSVLLVSADGQSFDVAFETDVLLPDGALVEKLAGTGIGTRINVD